MGVNVMENSLCSSKGIPASKKGILSDAIQILNNRLSETSKILTETETLIFLPQPAEAESKMATMPKPSITTLADELNSIEIRIGVANNRLSAILEVIQRNFDNDLRLSE
jgi:hypothetical protein